MNILVTGAKGFVGRNLVVNLYNLKENKNRTRPGISIDEIYEYDMDSTPEELDEYCRKADFVFNLAGVNRPKTKKAPEQGGGHAFLLHTGHPSGALRHIGVRAVQESGRGPVFCLRKRNGSQGAGLPFPQSGGKMGAPQL